MTTSAVPSINAQREYVERVAVLFEESGLQRMAGRLLAWLLICDPPDQTAGDLEVALQASKGSISTNLRVLLTAQLIERVNRPSERRDRYRIRDGAWSRAVQGRMSQIAVFREAFADGLALLADADATRRERLIDTHDLYEWLEEEMPAFWQRWETVRETRRAARRQRNMASAASDGTTEATDEHDE